MPSKTSLSSLISIIIIDYKIENPYLRECLQSLNQQSYTNYEILLLTDYQSKVESPKLKKHFFNRYASPAEKRDFGAKLARGEILAFIDDDAYPDKNWLKQVVKNFSDSQITAVGGPGVTPPGVDWRETASGWTSASPLGSGSHLYRFWPREKQFVDDYPSMNLSVRKKDFLAVGGYDSHYWPGEDTKLCLDLTHKIKKKIIYDPMVLVYHHRRPLWLPHLKQNGNFGLHRGYFAKILPQTSSRLIYFLPSFMSLGLIFIPLFLFIFPLFIIRWIFVLSLSFYGLALIINAFWIIFHSGSIFQGVISMPSIFLTHFWYGLKFTQGFIFTRKLKR